MLAACVADHILAQPAGWRHCRPSDTGGSLTFMSVLTMAVATLQGSTL